MSLSSLRLVDCRQTVDLVIPNTLVHATLAALTAEPETILEWKIQGIVPPCLAKTSSAYQHAGFGSLECLIYCELLRYLICDEFTNGMPEPVTITCESKITRLESVKASWLNNPQPAHGGRIPSKVIEWERQRLPLVCV